MRTRITVYAIGAGFILLGLWGVLTGTTNPRGWGVWFAGAVVVHDGIFVPCVLLLGALTTRLPASHRRFVQATLVVGGSVALVALPMVLGYGRRADNPSILPLAYGRNLIIALSTIAVVAVVWTALVRHRKRFDDTR
ncbi:hypothetical protein [Actinomadura sp. 6K520]|uniref:hypothetical protein n=1 Tax=Actinomadura sp. 6K520 TaxID=2530364 RepID=UPI00104EBB1F|nr:hypothetical protein [Actinomadura sp. 6K520]TDE33930.1 hypothetical protein E1289_10780 [Actinomadura sp. 6K520]